MSCDTPARLTHYSGRCHLNHIKVKSSQVCDTPARLTHCSGRCHLNHNMIAKAIIIARSQLKNQD